MLCNPQPARLSDVRTLHRQDTTRVLMPARKDARHPRGRAGISDKPRTATADPSRYHDISSRPATLPGIPNPDQMPAKKDLPSYDFFIYGRSNRHQFSKEFYIPSSCLSFDGNERFRYSRKALEPNFAGGKVRPHLSSRYQLYRCNRLNCLCPVLDRGHMDSAPVLTYHHTRPER